jgi:hypothetical protein
MRTLSAARRRSTEPRTAADELPIQALSHDGLLVRADGALVRYLSVIPTNPLVYDADGCLRLTANFTQLLQKIPAHMGVQCYVQADHVSLEHLVLGMRAETDAATRPLVESDDDLRRRQGHALRGLADMHEEGLCEWASSEAALSVRFVLVVPYEPAQQRRPIGALPVERPRRETNPMRRSLTDHLTHARDSLHLTSQLAASLRANGFTVTTMGGPDVADMLWSRLAPTKARALPEQSPSRGDLSWMGTLDRAVDRDSARAAASKLRLALAQGAIDTTAARHIAVDGDLELTGFLSKRPERTFYGWLLHAMQSPYPWTLSVHITMRDRNAERGRLDRQARRLYGLNATETGRPNDDQHAQEYETRAVRSELAAGGQSIVDVSIYLSVRQPGGDDPQTLREVALRALRAMASHVDAAAQQGEGQQPDLWRSTLPLGLDVAKRTVPMITRNAADSIPFCSTSCGSPQGIPFAFADPGRTVERINPFDRMHRNPLTLVYATSGSGKTMTLIELIKAAMPRGCQVSVVDRSDGGHYKFLSKLVPGCPHIELGTETSAKINCWDVADPAAVPKDKIVFLVQLHSLLLGGHEPGVDGPGLDVLERSLLGRAIRGTYRRAASLGCAPRESVLRDILDELAEQEAHRSPEHAAGYRDLALNVADLCEDGTYGYLFDAETSLDVDPEAPLVVFNTPKLPRDVEAAVLFIVFDYITSRVAHRWADQLERRTAGYRPAGPFDGTSMLVFEEVWKLIERPATAEAVTERARRGRHIGLWTVAVSQTHSDLTSPHARALVDNAQIHLLLSQSKEDLVGTVVDSVGLSQEEQGIIAGLQTIKGEVAGAYFVNGARGRAQVGIRVGTRSYWTGTSEAHEDVPLRALAERVAHENPWDALDLLADPVWRAEHQHAAAA